MDKLWIVLVLGVLVSGFFGFVVGTQNADTVVVDRVNTVYKQTVCNCDEDKFIGYVYGFDAMAKICTWHFDLDGTSRDVSGNWPDGPGEWVPMKELYPTAEDYLRHTLGNHPDRIKMWERYKAYQGARDRQTSCSSKVVN